MVELNDLRGIEGLDIKGLDEIIAGSRNKKRYEKWRSVETRLVQGGTAPSLSAHLLYQYWFNDKNQRELSEELGEGVYNLRYLMRKMRIPSKSASNRTTQREREMRRKRMSGGNNHMYGKTRSPETKKRISEAMSGRGRRQTQESIEKIRRSHQNEKLKEVDRRNGINAAKNSHKKKYFLNGHYFDSRGEAATGMLLQEYIQGYKLVEDKTFQANKDTHCLYDFVLENAIVEWHPINLKHDGPRFLPEDYKSYLELKTQVKSDEDSISINYLRKELKKDIGVEYWIRRQNASDSSEVYKGKEVVLARSLSELYEQVLSRYGKNIPPLKEVRRKFEKYMSQAKQELLELEEVA